MNVPKPTPPKTPLHVDPVKVPKLAHSIRDMTAEMSDDANTVKVVVMYDVNTTLTPQALAFEEALVKVLTMSREAPLIKKPPFVPTEHLETKPFRGNASLIALRKSLEPTKKPSTRTPRRTSAVKTQEKK